MSAVKHTPTPWSAVPSEGADEEWEVVIPFPGLKGEYLWIASCSGMGREYGSPQANAAFIVRAVNSHDELLAALKALQLQALQSRLNDPAHEWGWEALEMTRAAIAKAEGHPLQSRKE